MKKMIYISIACISLGFGALGAVLPLLPAFPFLLISAWAFARSSEKLDKWFKSTKLYKNNLENYVQGKGMTKACKIRVMCTISFLMAIGFIMMGSKGIIIGCVVLFVIWILHMLYFIFGVKNFTP